MTNPSGEERITTLHNVYNSPLTPAAGINSRYFLGKINWFDYAKDEMFLLIIPRGTELNSDVLAYWQWTKAKDDDVDLGGKLVNFKDIIRSVRKSSVGKIVSFGNDKATLCFTFEAIIPDAVDVFIARMNNPIEDQVGPFVTAEML